MQDLTGKVAAITGGASGIGRALADVFADRGMHIALADVEAGPLALAVRELNERGGDFECVPMLRTADDERYSDVAATLDGTRPERVTTVPMTPGTLMFFAGRHSLHRVTPVEGTTDRLVALLGYDTRPGTCSSELLRLVRYGRAEARRWPD